MADFNEEDIKNLSIDEIDELYKDIIEMPSPLIGGIADQGPVCLAKVGINFA